MDLESDILSHVLWVLWKQHHFNLVIYLIQTSQLISQILKEATAFCLILETWCSSINHLFLFTSFDEHRWTIGEKILLLSHHLPFANKIRNNITFSPDYIFKINFPLFLPIFWAWNCWQLVLETLEGSNGVLFRGLW